MLCTPYDVGVYIIKCKFYIFWATETLVDPENEIYFLPSVIHAGNIDALPLPRDAC